MDKIRILFDLRGGFGLGDVVAFGIVLRHLARYRPHWVIDCRAAPGAHEALIGQCNTVTSWNEPEPERSRYEQWVTLNLTDLFCLFPDRPSTKMAFALKYAFGIDNYDTDLGRYRVHVPAATMESIQNCLPDGVVAMHFSGGSHKANKDVPETDAGLIMRQVIAHGLMPLVLNPLMPFRGAAELAALARHAKAFIGIDSGPGKVASSTETPTLIVWTGHHPLRYHDPAPNTTHLVPEGYWEMPPLNDFSVDDYTRQSADAFFRANYKFATYRPGFLAQKVREWLTGVLK